MQDLDTSISRLCQNIGACLRQHSLSISCAESCTGGAIAEAITDVPGCSQWFHCSFVTYSNHSKSQLLGVDHLLIEREGAVSQLVVEAMAKGALSAGCADVSIAVSGIAGPSGATPDKPIGTVWIAWAIGAVIDSSVFYFDGDRRFIRKLAVEAALAGCTERLERVYDHIK